MKKSKIQEQLILLQDIGYRDFQAKLMPTISKDVIIGVRTPILRAYMKELKGTEEADTFLHTLPHSYYEENNLHGMLINQSKNYEECIRLVKEFLPYIDNWATCDGLSPKIFKKHREELLCEIAQWIESDHTYTVRFGIKMLMDFYLEEAFSEEFLEWIAKIRSEEYYINMMIAWYFATALAKQYDKTIPFIVEKKLDMWTHNKTIQKAVESYRITPEQKIYLRTLKWR